MNDLQFLKDLATENNLEWFINENNDLEIKYKNLCFHLADYINGEMDSLDRWTNYHNQEKRCVFVYPHYLENSNKVNVYKNILLYHCGKATRIYARNTVVKIYPAVQMKRFFEENNIEGYRNANKAYVLEDKKTGEPYMCYSVGHSYFGKGNYSAEIARGACKLGYQVIGGASKLWKYIIADNPGYHSIVYYVDRREYDQRSITKLMLSEDMQGVGSVHMMKGSVSFMNYWVDDVYLDGRLWHKAGEYKNREPNKNKAVQDAYRDGHCILVKNPGSFTNVFIRTGYHLEGLKVVPDDNEANEQTKPDNSKIDDKLKEIKDSIKKPATINKENKDNKENNNLLAKDSFTQCVIHIPNSEALAAYKVYKIKDGKLKWNDFQKVLKSGQININDYLE